MLFIFVVVVIQLSAPSEEGFLSNTFTAVTPAPGECFAHRRFSINTYRMNNECHGLGVDICGKLSLFLRS